MPGRSKLTELIDNIYAKMLLRLKALLQQSTSVSLTTDAAKMPTGDSNVAVTCHWISTDWCLMSAVLGVSISNVSHTAEEIVSLLNELGVKYTLDDRLDAIATDNGANFVAAVEELLETGICEEHVRCACHTLQLSIKNYIDPAKPNNAPAAPTNPTSDLVSTFRKLVNKIHASPLMTENLRTAQIGGPAAELIMEETDEDNTDDTQQATRQVIEGGGNTAVNSLGFHRSPRGHTQKLIQDVVTRWNSTYYMLERCIHLQIPLC